MTTTTAQPDVLVLGAGITGLTAALMLAVAGHRVRVLERDSAPPPAPDLAWDTWHRPGVGHLRQPHLMLPRWYQEMAAELPDLIDRLTSAGARPVNTLDLQPLRHTRGSHPDDHRFDTIAARRPLIEAALAGMATDHPRVILSRGMHPTGLLLAAGRRGRPRVIGVRTTSGDAPAPLVVDATGRHTPVPGWLLSAGLTGPVQDRDHDGFTYYSRHFRHDGPPVVPAAGILTHQPSLSVLTLPGDGDTFSIVLAVSAHDRALRRLRDDRVWTSVARLSPAAAPWLAAGRPITGVTPFSGLADVVRDYTVGGDPLVSGLVAIGDAQAATTPLLGRGTSLGALAAVALRDVLALEGQRAEAVADRFWLRHREVVMPWVNSTRQFSQDRLGELGADEKGVPYQPAGPGWPLSLALRAGAGRDPVLARAASRIACMLDLPETVLREPEVQRHLGPALGAAAYPADAPTRSEVTSAAA